MNILHTIETHGPGGAESVLVNLAESFPGSRYKAHGFFIKEGWIADQFREKGLPVTVCPIHSALDPMLLCRLVSYIIRHDIDLIHAHEFTMGFYSAAASRLTGVGCVVTIHGKQERTLLKKRRYHALNYVLGKMSCVAVSHDLGRWIASNFPSAAPPTVVHNGIDTTVLSENVGRRVENRRGLCERLGVSEQSVLVVTVARLFRVKGIEVLLEAASMVLSRTDNVHFIIAGDGPERDSLTGMAREMGIEDRVHFLGETDTVPQVLTGSDLFALSSHSEGLSIAILEAMAAGLPVVATDVGDNGHLVRSGCNGFTVAPAKPELLAEKITVLTGDPDTRKKFGKRSRRIVQMEFENHHMLTNYEKIYRKVVR